MKADIHPQWYPQAKVTCACGATFSAGSTLPEIKVDICSKCHPFFTGEMKYVDTLGRVEKFQAKQKQATGYVKKKVRQQTEKEKEEKRPQTLREMLKNKKVNTA